MFNFRKLSIILVGAMVAFAMCGCGQAEKSAAVPKAVPQAVESAASTNKVVQRVVIRKGNQQAVFMLGQGNAAKDLYKRLPLKIKFEDFNNTEKIAYLNSALNLQGEPKGYTPQVGDLAYYAPWKNLSLFYKEFRYSENLIYLGKLEKGSINLENFEGADIVLEAVK